MLLSKQRQLLLKHPYKKKLRSIFSERDCTTVHSCKRLRFIWTGNIGPNGYLKLKTPNSTALLEAKNFGKPLKMNLDLDQGESYYFYVRSKLGWLRNEAYLESIPPEEGKAKINSLRGPKRKESVGSE